jgi:hypothetical protein
VALENLVNIVRDQDSFFMRDGFKSDANGEEIAAGNEIAVPNLYGNRGVGAGNLDPAKSTYRERVPRSELKATQSYVYDHDLPWLRESRKKGKGVFEEFEAGVSSLIYFRLFGQC